MTRPTRERLDEPTAALPEPVPAVKRRRTSPLALLALLALGAGSVDCAARPPIDQTGPDRLRKSFFVGANLRDATDNPEFYMNNFVVASSADQSLMPAGTYDDVERIRWEIQEDTLIARRSYENVTGAEAGRVGTRQTNNGTVVAAYRITKHYDVRPAYNPTTGEPLNIITENTTDRPWYEREYMRIDWSQNLVANPGWRTVFFGQMFGELSFEPVRYHEQDPNSPNAPNFREMEPVPGQRHNGGYFDVTSKWLVSPQRDPSTGLPTCWMVNFFSGSNTYECNPQETTIRTSFRRVEDRDFEPLELTRAPYDIVVGPRTTRNGYDPAYGATDANFHRYAMIHNLWQRSHLAPAVACRSNADDNHDGTADACATAGHPGSQCDTVMEQCTIPYHERQVRPIVYYLNPETPPEFQNHVESAPDANGLVTYRLPQPSDAPAAIVQGASEQIIASWNLAIMTAIANAREVECRRLGPANGGGDRDTCHARFFENGAVPQEDGAFLGAQPRAANGPAVVLCHNPVRAGDPSECREEGYSVRLGDIRYNHLGYWEGHTRARFGGIAHWGYDPLTGEVVSNGAFNVGRSVEYAAAQQRDYIRLILSQMDPPQDNLSLAEYVGGAPAAVLAQHIRHPAADLRDGRMLSAMSQTELDERVAGVDPHHAATQLGMNLPEFGSDVGAATQYLTQRELAAASVPGTTAAARINQLFRDAARNLHNTPIETAMIDPHWLANSGVDPRSQLTQGVLDQVSPLRGLDPESASALRSELLTRLESRGFCFQDHGAPPMIGSANLQGVARWFLQRYRDLSPAARANRIYQDLRVEAYRGIAIHEVGHSLGLYHVPVSSYDSANYLPQYWQLRTRNGTAAGTCRPACSPSNPNCPSVRNADRNDDNCMGPRYLDPATDEELGVAPTQHPHAAVEYYGNTSVMEYNYERFGETVGIGAYDQYAMGILYGRVIETMEADPRRGGMSTEEQTRFAPRMASQLSEQDRIVWADPSLTTPDRPLTLPVHYTELARQLQVFDPARCRDATPEEQARYRWRLIDGKICSFGPRDHAAMWDFESTPTSADSTRAVPYWRTTETAATGGHQLRWAYRVSYDTGTGYPHINYFDQGADIYEVAQGMMQKYDLLYPTMYFRRGQREWASRSIAAGVAASIFQRVRGYHWSVARDVAQFSSVFNEQTFNAVAASDHFLRPYLVAGTSMFDFFAGVVLRPDVGGFAPVALPPPEMSQMNLSLFDVTTSSATPSPFRIGVVSGRFIAEEFDSTAVGGGSWDYHHWMIRAGSYMEKPYAAMALADTRPAFSSISRGLFLDGREFHVNFGTDMPQAMDRLLGGILAEDWAAVGMHVDRTAPGGTPETELAPLVPRLWERGAPVRRFGADNRTPLTGAGQASVLFPNVGYRQQLPTLVFAMLFSSLGSDLTLVNKMRVFVEGGSEAVDIPEAERVRFTNPESGITYVARAYGADPGYAGGEMVGTRAVDRGIASRMLQHANALMTRAYQSDGTAADGRPILRRDAMGNLVPAQRTPNAQAQAVTTYRNYVGLIDAARNVSRLLGYGQAR